MKEDETVKDYVDKLIKIVMRLLGIELLDSKIMEKMLENIPEKFKSKIFAFEEPKDLTMMTFQELVNAFQAFEAKR